MIKCCHFHTFGGGTSLIMFLANRHTDLHALNYFSSSIDKVSFKKNSMSPGLVVLEKLFTRTQKLMPTLQSDFYFYLFGVLRRFQHCIGHIMTGTWKGRGNQYKQFVRVLYCKLPTNGKQLPAFPLEALPGIEPRPQRWEARVLPLCHRGPYTAE